MICDTYKELLPHTTSLDDKMQLSISRLAIEESISDFLPYAEVTDKTLKSYPQGENLAVEMEIKCIEDIAVKLPVLEETDGRTNS